MWWPISPCPCNHGRSLPAQRAESEADIWIGWGIHVFKVTGGAFKQGTVLEDYLQAKFDAVTAQPGDDFFSALTRATYRGRPLTREEVMGFANLTFAGGRDTIIHTLADIIAYLGCNPAALTFLRDDPRRIVHAGEEFFRYFMPLTHIGRVCPRAPTSTEKKCRLMAVFRSRGPRPISTRPSLPHRTRCNSTANPIRTYAFGFGPHLCLGAAHARLIVRTFLQALVYRVAAIEIIAAVDHIEREAAYQRINGFDSLTVRLVAR
jgi:cytochrome P450